MQTFNPAYGPTYPYEESIDPRVKTAKFADGYEQRTGDGINTMPGEIPLTWENLTQAEHDYIWTFFKDRGGIEAFQWTPPQESTPRKFKTLGAFKHAMNDKGVWTITATFKELFEP